MKSARLAILIGLSLALFVAVVAYSASSSGDLLLDLPESALPQASALLQAGEIPSQAVRTRLTGVNLRLAEMVQSGQVHSVRLFSDAEFNFQVRETQRRDGRLSAVGVIPEIPESMVALAAQDGQIALDIFTPQALYQVRYLGEDVYVVFQIDQSLYPDEAQPQSVPDSSIAQREEQPAQAPVAAQDDGSQIDVLVAYTPAARTRAGGTTAIQNLITLAEAETNQSYQNSQVTQRIRVVHRVETPYPESSSIYDELSYLTYKSDGYMDELHSLRDAYKADLVVLLTNNNNYPGYCGVAWQMEYINTSFESWAFSVVAVPCATGYFSFAHETGHNMGARHDWGAPDSGTLPYTYAHGYVNVPDRWRTIMAYNTQCGAVNCTRLQYWSNPNLRYAGDPMGVPENTCTGGVGCDAFNAKVLNNTAYTVSNFRVGTPPTPTPTPTRTATPTITPTPTPTPYPPLLLVDDDDNLPNVQAYYSSPLSTLSVRHDVWDVLQRGAEPAATQIAPYHSLVWFTGDTYGSQAGPSTASETILGQWLEAGGCLIISSQDYSDKEGSMPNVFMQNYLGVSAINSDVSYAQVQGIGVVFGDSSYAFQLPSGFLANYTDLVYPAPDGQTVFQSPSGSAAVGKQASGYTSLYLGFPFEFLPDSASRITVMQSLLEFCGYGWTYLPLINR
jgi:hypothetical protein